MVVKSEDGRELRAFNFKEEDERYIIIWSILTLIITLKHRHVWLKMCWYLTQMC